MCLQCVENRGRLKKVRRTAGNKPRTTSLATRRSTTELCPQYRLIIIYSIYSGQPK